QSAAAKAGLKANDILLEVDGKAVSNEPQDLVRMLQGFKPDTTVDVTVLRKGRKETIKGITLPEAAPPQPGFAPGGFGGQRGEGAGGGLPGRPGRVGDPAPGPGGLGPLPRGPGGAGQGGAVRPPEPPAPPAQPGGPGGGFAPRPRNALELPAPPAQP